MAKYIGTYTNSGAVETAIAQSGLSYPYVVYTTDDDAVLYGPEQPTPPTPPEPPTPVQDNYYYQMSGGSLIQMTFDGDESYYVSGLTLLPISTNAIRFYKNSDLISAASINTEESHEGSSWYSFFDAGEDEYLNVAFPITSISIKPIDDPNYDYQTECTLAPVYIEIDGTAYEMTNNGGSYEYSTENQYCPGVSYKIKTLNTYATLMVYYPDDPDPHNVGSAYTPDYCIDYGCGIMLGDFNYYESTLTTNPFDITQGYECKPYLYYNGSNSYLVANNYEEFNLEENSMSVGPFDTIGVMDAADNLPCGCEEITIKDENGNTLGTQYGGSEWENDTEDTFTSAERQGCDLVLKTGGGGDEPWE